MTRQPIIIIGNSRSGTTMLRLMLTCHQNICIPPEGPFVFFLEPKYGQFVNFDDYTLTQFVDDLLQVPKMEEWHLDRNRLLHRLKTGPRKSFFDLADGVYRTYMEIMGQVKPRWGDKSGSYTIHSLKSVRRSLPQAFLLHIVRDGRDVACSYRALQGMQGKYAPNLPTSPFAIADQWQTNVRHISQFLSKWPVGQQAEIRYEDLVTSPELTLQALCTKLDEVYDPNMLDFHRQNVEQSLEPKVYMAWKQKTREEVSASQVGRWKTELSETEVRCFEALARDMLQQYGYRLSQVSNGKLKSSRLRLEMGLFHLKKMIYRIALGIKRRVTAIQKDL